MRLVAFLPSTVVLALHDPYLFTASAAMVLTGIVLLCLAFRGRRIDHHPVCRRCRFDLIGLPPDAHKCSECGADLKRRRAVRIGNRQRRWGWMLLGSLLILENGSWLSVQTRQMLADTDWDRHKPAWWLLAEARNGRNTAALPRLVGLWEKGELSSSQCDEVVRLLLAAQTNPNKYWSWEWGYTLEKMHQKQMVKDEDWQTYWHQYYGLALNAFQRDDQLVVYVTQSPQPRTRLRFSSSTRIDLGSVRLGETPLFPPQFVLGGQSFVEPPVKFPVPPSAKLANGPQTLHAIVDLYVTTDLGESKVRIPLKAPFEYKVPVPSPDH